MHHGGMGFGVGHAQVHVGGAGSPIKVADDEILGKAYDHGIVARMAKYVLPYRGWTVLALLAVLFYTGATVAMPLVVKWGIDSYIRPGLGTGDASGLTWVALVFLLVTLVHYGANYISSVR